MFKLKQWFRERVEGYILTKGVAKLAKGALVALSGAAMTVWMKPEIEEWAAKMRDFGVATSFDGHVFSLQVNLEILVTAVVGGVALMGLNFFFRSK